MFIVGDSPASLTFTVSVDERRFASLGNVADDTIETDIRRRYVTRTVQQRLHQQEFRERVLEAYQRHCAICRLRHDQLLEAAHIVGDREALGMPAVPNGIALCSLHHPAFDAHLMTVRPDYRIEVRHDVLAFVANWQNPKDLATSGQDRSRDEKRFQGLPLRQLPFAVITEHFARSHETRILFATSSILRPNAEEFSDL